MKIVIAPDSFKGSISAEAACAAIASGVRQAWPYAELISVPLSDGGEGTASTLAAATGGRMMTAPVQDPLGRPMQAQYALLGNGRTAVVEMAAASGLTLLSPAERNPLVTSTFGTGQLIKVALDQGVEELIVAIGGSATNDGGSGALQALGAKLLDSEGRELPPGGAALLSLQKLDLSGIDQRLHRIRLRVACDVDNPLTGIQGASRVFGPQKGATASEVELLDLCLAHWGAIIGSTIGRDLGMVPGAGAAGGLGVAMLLLDGELQRGIEIVLDTLQIEQYLRGTDLIVTGEGRIDGQTARGKTIWGIAQRARRLSIPVVALVGSEGDGCDGLYSEGVDAILPIGSGPLSLEESMASAAQLLHQAARRMTTILETGWRMKTSVRESRRVD